MNTYYDVVILGAGINGVGVADVLAKEGKSVLVIDKGSIGGGTSSHSSRLIHGGLRYLETFDFPLVSEALSDRTRLTQKYPNLVELRPFYLPIFKESSRPAFVIAIGLWLYDLFSKFIAVHHRVKKDDFLRDFPAIRSQGLKKVFVYYDGKTNDLALTQTVASEAKEDGADFLENTAIDTIKMSDAWITLKIEDQTIQTHTLVNATGPWMDEVTQKYQLPANYNIRKVSGIHIVLKGLLVPSPLLLQASGERIFFIIPEPQNDQTLIGTTERTQSEDCDAVTVVQEDIDYLLREVNVYLKEPLTRDDVMESFIGIRPLVASKKSDNKSSREYKLDLHKRGQNQLLNIYGGKLTTFYSLSQKVVKKLF